MRMSRRDLYALGEPFGSSATSLKAGSKNRTYGSGDGGSSAPTQTTVQNTNLPDYVQPYVMSMLGAAQKQMFNTSGTGADATITGFKPYVPYSTDPSQYVAGFSPLQTQAQTGIANLTVPGQFGAATGATAGAMNQLANNTYNPLASNYLSAQAPQLQNYSMQNPGNVGAAQTQAAQLGQVPLAQAAGFQGPGNVSAQNVNAPNLQNYQMQGPADVSATGVSAPTMQGAQTNFNPNLNTFQMGPASNVTTQDFTQGNTAQQFMNPYIKQALDPQLAEMERQYGITGQQEQSAATQAGAMGGSREALMAAENQRNKNTAMNAAIGQGYNTAYQSAMQQFNAQQNANLQAQQANQQAGINVGGQNLAAQLGVQQLGTQSGLQAQLANLSNAQQAAVNNQATQFQANGMNAQQALQAALANQQAGLTTGQQNLAANLGVQQLGAQNSLQAQQLNQAAGLQAGLANQSMGYNTGLQNAQLAQQANLANQGILGQYGLQQGQMTQQANLANQQMNQQANLANQQNAYNVGAQNLAAQLGIQQLGAGQNLAAQQANQSAYAGAQNLAANQQQFGANYGLQNLQALLGGAAQLGNLGTNQLAAQQSVLNAQSTAGAAQQAQQQQIINQAINNYAMAQQMPMQNLANLSALLHGLPLQNTTTSMYQAAPSTISQIAGLGTGAAGLAKLAAKGGSVSDIKKMAGGGIASLENRQRLAENYSPKQLQQEVQAGVLPQGIGGVLSQDYSNMQKAAEGMKAQQAMAQTAQAQQIQQQQAPGVTGLPSNLPVQGMAQGGIIAFDDGGDVSSSTKITKDPIHWDYEAEKPDYTQADAILASANAAPHDMDAVFAARQAEETKRGIGDVYTPMLANLKEKEAALSGKKDQAQGLALLAAGAKMMGSTSPYAGVGLGAGLGEYASNYGAASDKLDALKENYDQQNNTVMLAQNAYKEAALTNDTNRMDKAKATIVAAQDNKQKLTEKYKELQDAGNLKKAEKTADYYKEIDKEKFIATKAKDTDLRNTTDIYYKDMVENKGYPAGSATMALARQTAYKDVGLAERKVMVQESQAENTLTHQQNQDIAAAHKQIDKKYALDRAGAFGDAAALAQIDAKIDAEKEAAKQDILRSKAKPGASASSKPSKDAVQSTGTLFHVAVPGGVMQFSTREEAETAAKKYNSKVTE